MALETFATKASEELLLMMMRTTLPQYALSNVNFFLSKTYPSLGRSSIFINMGSLQPHDFLIIFRSISAQCLNYWHWRPITPIDWQLCLFFFSKVFRVHELFALFWICYFYFCHILMSAPLLPCLLRLLFVPFMRFVDAGKKIRFISSI